MMTFENLFLSRWKLDLPVREEKERWPLFALRCFNYFSGSLITFAFQFLRKFKKTKTNSILLILFQLLHLRDEQIAFTIKLRFNRINLNLVQRLYWHPSLHQSSLWTQKQRKLLLLDAPIMFLSIRWCHSGCKKGQRPHAPMTSLRRCPDQFKSPHWGHSWCQAFSPPPCRGSPRSPGQLCHLCNSFKKSCITSNIILK